MKRFLLGAALVLPVAALASLFVPCPMRTCHDSGPDFLVQQTDDGVRMTLGEAQVLVSDEAPDAAELRARIERALASQAASRQRARPAASRADMVPAVAAAAKPASMPRDAATVALCSAAETVVAYYRDGRRDAADELVAQHPQIVTWDEAQAGGNLRVSSIYRDRMRGGEMELLVARQPGSSEEPVAVAFAPGTYGTAMRVQELALLRAPVVVLGTGEQQTSVRVPVACASFNLRAPQMDKEYSLRRFEPGSDIDRLMVALCAGDGAPEADAQLAVWIVRDDITVAQMTSHGRVITFQTALPVGTWNGPGAAELLRQSGLDPEKIRFYKKQAPARPAPQQQQRPQREAPATPAVDPSIS